MQYKTPIYDALKEYKDKCMLPFHMPGHKMGRGIEPEFKENIASYDLTEIYGMDNLHCPEGIIKESQQLASSLFGASHSFYLVNGSSAGIQAMIMSVCNPGEKIIVQRNCHKSVIDGIILSGAAPVYILPCMDYELQTAGCVTLQSVRNIIEKNPDAKAVIITNPHYFGLCSDIKNIIDAIHSGNMIAMVDEAHGAHFYFNDRLPLNALKAGADICVNSLHKTLPAFTQCSILHVNSRRIDIERLRFMLGINQTTSPSYIFLACMDLLRKKMALQGEELLDKLIIRTVQIRDRINTLSRLKCFELRYNYKNGVKDTDATKLLINVCNTGLSGNQAERILREKHNIQIEMSSGSNILLITTIADSHEMLQHLENSICTLETESMGTIELYAEEKYPVHDILNNIPKQILFPRDAVYSIMESRDINEAYGEISGELISAYPPGAPIICPGELLEPYIVDYIKQAVDKNIMLYGMQDSSGKTIKVIKQ